MTPTTPHSRRPIVPELRDVPLTFLTCEWRRGKSLPYCVHRKSGTNASRKMLCDCNYRDGRCPVGWGIVYQPYIPETEGRFAA